jgi:methionyl-tRNA formyltransferase
MGTPLFALDSLKAIAQNHKISAVITQPDKRQNRGYKLTPPPVKIFSDKNNIKTFQPERLADDELISALSNISPDLIVVAAYGKILPESILNLPKFGCINVHASLLPKYRGAAPIAWAIINGEKKTGITIMQMDKGLDTGDIILQKEVNISEKETEGELRQKLSAIGAQTLTTALEMFENKTVVKTPQNNNLSSLAPIIKKEFSVINWGGNADDIHNLVRGFNPWPCSRTFLRGKLLKIHKTEIDTNCDLPPGAIKQLNPLIVSCLSGSLEILEVQPEGKKIMSAQDFVHGNNIDLQTTLGI